MRYGHFTQRDGKAQSKLCKDSKAVQCYIRVKRRNVENKINNKVMKKHLINIGYGLVMWLIFGTLAMLLIQLLETLGKNTI